MPLPASVSQAAASWCGATLMRAPAASLPASDSGVGSASRAAFGERFNLWVSDFLSVRRESRVCHIWLLRGLDKSMFVKPLGQSQAASAMCSESENREEGQRRGQSDGEMETDGEREGDGRQRGGGRGRAWAPLARLWLLPDSGANFLGD